jgi:hypothetical protein
MNYCEIIADNLSKAGVGAVSQPWVLAGGRSSLLTRIAMTESGSLCGDEKLSAFVELEAVIQECSKNLILGQELRFAVFALSLFLGGLA